VVVVDHIVHLIGTAGSTITHWDCVVGGPADLPTAITSHKILTERLRTARFRQTMLSYRFQITLNARRHRRHYPNTVRQGRIRFKPIWDRYQPPSHD
jgi:hypothetical protein